MVRKVYITNGIINLSEYIESEDDLDCYKRWLEDETQSGYNHKVTETFDEWSNEPIKSRFIATIIRILAILIYKLVPHQEGNVQEKHYLTGENITQFDFVKYNTQMKKVM